MPKNLPQSNLELLHKFNPHIYSEITTAADLDIEVITNKNADVIPVLNINNKKLSLHSKINPQKEAERLTQDIIANEFDLYVIIGFAFAYHIEKILQNIPAHANVLVIEKEAAIISVALQERNLNSILQDSRLKITVNPSEDDLTELLKGKSTKTVSFLTHRGSFQAYPEYYNNILTLTKSYISTKDVNIATLAKFEKIWSSNIARNIGFFSSTPGVIPFYNRFKDIPAIIIGAGPSLSKDITFIKKHKEDAILIAVDTALKSLLNEGIEPHFCLAVDPQIINARYFENTPELKTILVTEPTVHPSVFHLYKGPIITTGVSCDLLKWW